MKQRHSQPDSISPAAGWALVLGGGGAVGAAYIAGALQGLQSAGLDLASASLVIGTSAGSIAAAQLRSGAGPAAILAIADAPGDAGGAGRHFRPAWHNRRQLARRVVGSTAVVARSMLRVPLPAASRRVEAAFPGGLFEIADDDRFADVVPECWPGTPLWLVAVDLAAGRRRAFGKLPGDRQIPLRDVVRASCAVPGFYEPVRIDGHRFVDGGVRSTTSLDYAVYAGFKRIICIAPLGCGPGDAQLRPGQAFARKATIRGLRRELRVAHDQAADVLVVEPRYADLEVMGANFLRSTGNSVVAELARAQLAEPTRAVEVRQFVARCVDGT